MILYETENIQSLGVLLKVGFSNTYVDIVHTFEKSFGYLQLVFCCSRSHSSRSFCSLWTCRLKTKLMKFLIGTNPRIDRLTTLSGSGASKLQRSIEACDQFEMSKCGEHFLITEPSQQEANHRASLCSVKHACVYSLGPEFDSLLVNQRYWQVLRNFLSPFRQMLGIKQTMTVSFHILRSSSFKVILSSESLFVTCLLEEVSLNRYQQSVSSEHREILIDCSTALLKDAVSIWKDCRTSNEVIKLSGIPVIQGFYRKRSWPI